MVRLAVSLGAGPGQSIDALFEALRFLSTGTRLESGCLGCSVWVESDSTVHYVEEWETEADMRRRVRSARFTSLLSVMEAAEEQPQVRFDFVTSSRAIDYVAEIRGESPH